jgi:hypothetical protein
MTGSGGEMRFLQRAAFFAAAANLVAAIGMAVVLRPGLPGLGSLQADRLTYITQNTAPWRVGWLLWNVAALSLILLFVALRSATAPGSALARFALLGGAAGLAADLAAETLMMGVEPTLSPGSFAPWEHAAVLLTGYLGNGLYALCGALLTASWRGIPTAICRVSVPLWCAGGVLSAVTLLDLPDAVAGATAAVMALFVVWSVMVGIWARRQTS